MNYNGGCNNCDSCAACGSDYEETVKDLEAKLAELQRVIRRANELIMVNYPDGGQQQKLWLECLSNGVIKA